MFRTRCAYVRCHKLGNHSRRSTDVRSDVHLHTPAPLLAAISAIIRRAHHCAAVATFSCPRALVQLQVGLPAASCRPDLPAPPFLPHWVVCNEEYAHCALGTLRQLSPGRCLLRVNASQFVALLGTSGLDRCCGTVWLDGRCMQRSDTLAAIPSSPSVAPADRALQDALHARF